MGNEPLHDSNAVIAGTHVGQRSAHHDATQQSSKPHRSPALYNESIGPARLSADRCQPAGSTDGHPARRWYAHHLVLGPIYDRPGGLYQTADRGHGGAAKQMVE